MLGLHTHSISSFANYADRERRADLAEEGGSETVGRQKCSKMLALEGRSIPPWPIMPIRRGKGKQAAANALKCLSFSFAGEMEPRAVHFFPSPGVCSRAKYRKPISAHLAGCSFRRYLSLAFISGGGEFFIFWAGSCAGRLLFFIPPRFGSLWCRFWAQVRFRSWHVALSRRCSPPNRAQRKDSLAIQIYKEKLNTICVLVDSSLYTLSKYGLKLHVSIRLTLILTRENNSEKASL